MKAEVQELQAAMHELGYIAEPAIATALALLGVSAPEQM